MQISIEHRPSYALAVIKLDAEETVVAETGSMVSMDTHIEISTSAGKKGEGKLKGLMKGLKRLVAGESFMQNRYTASGAPGEVTFAPTLQGDIDVHELNQGTFFLQSSAFVCSDERIEMDAKWGGAKTFFGGEGLIMLKATGTGPVVFNSFGAIKEIDVVGAFTVDTGHIVAFEDTLQFNVTKFGGGWKSFLLGGEGLVCSFTGTGKLWIQTRNSKEFAQLLARKLPPREH
jgi:uncharacterized protein (TIGR00266 family)